MNDFQSPMAVWIALAVLVIFIIAALIFMTRSYNKKHERPKYRNLKE